MKVRAHMRQRDVTVTAQPDGKRRHIIYGQLTQLGECLLDVEKVSGSSPLLPTNQNPSERMGFLFCCAFFGAPRYLLLARGDGIILDKGVGHEENKRQQNTRAEDMGHS